MRCHGRCDTHGRILPRLSTQTKRFQDCVQRVPSTQCQVVNSGRELEVTLNSQPLRHEPRPVYLGVTLDRTLDYKQHLIKIADKVNSRNNLLMKLANSSWGADSNTLRSSTLALCYSAAEYC